MTAIVSGQSDLFTLQQQAWTLKEDLKRNYLALAEVLRLILETDKWREAGYKNRRAYCDDQLGMSYEWCRKIIRGALASQHAPQLTSELSADAADELSKIEVTERAAAIRTVTIEGRVTASRLKSYRKIKATGETPTPKRVVEFLDEQVECAARTLVARHSHPPALLRKLLQQWEDHGSSKSMDAQTDSRRVKGK